MKNTKASTNAPTYQEYLEQREKELQEEVKFWHRAWRGTRAENAELKARIAELEKLALYLDKQSDAKTALIGQIIDDLAQKEEENERLMQRLHGRRGTRISTNPTDAFSPNGTLSLKTKSLVSPSPGLAAALVLGGTKTKIIAGTKILGGMQS